MGKKITKNEFLETIASMSAEQFDSFAKDNNRSIRDMVLYSQGELHISQSVWKLTEEIISSVVEIENLEAEHAFSETPTMILPMLEEAKHKLENHFKNFEDKVDSFGAAIRLLEKDIERYKSLENIVYEKKKRIEKSVMTIKRRCSMAMQTLTAEKIEGTYFTAKLLKPLEKLEYTQSIDVDSIPINFLSLKAVINEEHIKEYLKQGNELDFAELKEYRNVSFI